MSKITGFYECVREAQYQEIPSDGLPVSEGRRLAWLIEGIAVGPQPSDPTDVGSIEDLLGRRIYKQQTLIPINVEDFEKIQQKACSPA
jgi:hypothetical protein